MSVLSKQQLKVASSKRVKMSLDAQHVTTGQFLQLQPVYYRHMIPNEKINVNVDSLIRLAPLAVPTFGRANLNLRAFFVPYRTVCPYFNEFITDTVYSDSSDSAIPSSVPTISSDMIYNCFVNSTIYSSEAFVTSSTTAPSAWDFKTSTRWYTYTAIGRRAIKLLNSLGYRLIPYGDKSAITYNALALLAFARIYFDWYSLGQYRDSSTVLAVGKLLAKNSPSSAYALTSNDLKTIFELILSPSYDQDYFTAAWDNPVSPADSNSSAVSMNDITTALATTKSTITHDDNFLNGTSVLSPAVEDGKSFISEQGLHMLHALNNYQRRHQMSGARAVDRFLVQYGIQLDSAKLNRSVYIGSNTSPLQIGDVTSMANTAGAGNTSNLGDYAGRGHVASNSSFDYESDEFGIFIVVASVIPAIGYVQGYDRNNRHLTRFDFFTNEFDNCGVQVTEKGELYVSKDVQFTGGNNGFYAATFGFLPRYAEYKVGRDWLTGDFATSIYAGSGSWHLFRMFDDTYFGSSASTPGINNVYHDIDFCLATDRAGYNRIFNYTDSDVDNMFMFFNFNVTSYVPALPLYDTYIFENEENHDSVTIEANGTKLN
ncbi:MAG: hypothetical protein MJZ97_09055 [Bacteroidales bacterium]|nr:hypothetical protein [Bacteroidales bacterium]